jgi:hypothetical protein
MPALLADAIGWAGAVGLLLAYAGLATRRLTAGVRYHALNLVGAGGLAFNGAFHHAWPSTALNVVWLAIGVVALRGPRRSRGRTDGDAGDARDARRGRAAAPPSGSMGQ